MTDTDAPTTAAPIVPDFGDEDTDRKMCFIASKGTLDMIYPSMIMANAALMEGVETHIFFTFWGMDAVTKKHMGDLQFTWMGNTAMHPPNGSKVHMPQGLAGLPGMTHLATKMMKKQIADLEIPEVPELLQMIQDAGGQLWACKLSADMMGLTEEDLMDDVPIITAADFIELSAGAQIIFT